MVERSADWFRQARRDLEVANKSSENGYWEWACFTAQQSAEKALKAILQKKGYDVWGHSLLKLCQELILEEPAAERLIDDAKELDKLYIPTRYPNGFASGAPMDYYTVNDARNSIASSERILDWVEERLKEN